MYKIAKRLTLEERRAAAQFDYTHADIPYCPLGVVLKTHGIKSPRPSPYRFLNSYPKRLSIDEISDFMHAWDKGKIHNLYEAMGLKKPVDK